MTEPATKSIVDRIAAFRESGDPDQLTDAIPYARFMGIHCERTDDGIVGRMRYADHLVGNPALPALHGGTMGALLESTAIFHLLWEAETLVIPKTITITVDYLRSARPVDTFAAGITTKMGRRVVNVRTEAWQDDRSRPIAIAHTHLLIVPREG